MAYHSFDETEVSNAISFASESHAFMGKQAGDRTGFDFSQSGEMAVLAHCISVTVKDHKICLELPKPFSKQFCIPIPLKIPDGTAAQACLTICTILGIPRGVKITISVAGVVILTKVFGSC